MRAHAVAFHRHKAGNSPGEWEDGAGHGPDRFIVVDGATEAYDSLRWVEQLVGSFLDRRPPISPTGMDDWFRAMQARWVQEAPARFANVIEEHKFRTEGSFATFVGGELTGLDGPRPCWEAAALGDTVLFHVRDGRLLHHFPALSADDFGLTPDGIDTRPAALPRMTGRLAFGRGPLLAGDLVLVATDAVAHWMLRQAARPGTSLWRTLAALDHNAAFAELVAGERRAGRLHNDDCTLLRVSLADAPPRRLVVGL